MLNGRRVVLGVTGGIAAYKAAYLARRLVEAGATVRTVMTAASRQFLGEQTLAAITGTRPTTDFFGGDSVSPHTELARWAECIVIAPATAATLARLANGHSDDVLSATVLAFTGPVVVVPAMHTEMWEHSATRRNAERLRSDGVTLVGPAVGSLAGGDSGEGRMVEPEEIVAAVTAVFAVSGSLGGRSVLVSAGGTREPIDPVRYVGNRSSGKMGNAIALEAARRGAQVTLVTTMPAPAHPLLEVVSVETAAEMADAVWARAGDADVAVLAAAVADFAPSRLSEAKVRRVDGPPTVDFVSTPDILAGVAANARRPFLVGFAAETGPVSAASAKATTKDVDLLVANDVTEAGAGFGTDTNRVTLFLPDGASEEWPMMPKQEVASRLWDRIIELSEP
jgi:phosphopantothenoylcysteine decarboxylase / phosphopantothenate---cysteine ligase